MAATFGLRLEGTRALERKLLMLSGPRVLAITARATQIAMKPVVAAARALVAVESKTLRRSLGAKTVKYRGRGIAVTVVGPRKGFGRMVTIKGKSEYRDPIKYAHLVEFGHRVARKGTTLLKKNESVEHGRKRAKAEKRHLSAAVGFVEAKPFLRPAFFGNEKRILSTYRQELADGIMEAATK
jgi:HK97 gp10 family phage protein